MFCPFPIAPITARSDRINLLPSHFPKEDHINLISAGSFPLALGQRCPRALGLTMATHITEESLQEGMEDKSDIVLDVCYCSAVMPAFNGKGTKFWPHFLRWRFGVVLPVAKIFSV